jgi:mRNA-degrading endonuclease RelE of RelBE toxin-antitoxin system
MRAEIDWAAPAFRKLEELPESKAFDIVRRVDVLAAFPEMGVSLRSRYAQLGNCRQLIVGGSYRVVYEYDADSGLVYILDVQHCRGRLPTAAELRYRLRHKNQSE